MKKNTAKNSILFLGLFLSLAACNSGGGGGGGNALTAAQQQQQQQLKNGGFVANDPSTPIVSLDHAIVGTWSTNCQKANVPTVPYMADITEFRANGTVYKSFGYFTDNTCTIGAESGQIQKVGTYEVLSTADIQPVGEVQIISSFSSNQLGQGQMRDGVFHVAISGANARNMQITTSDMAVKQGGQFIDEAQAATQPSSIAHRVMGI